MRGSHTSKDARTRRSYGINFVCRASQLSSRTLRRLLYVAVDEAVRVGVKLGLSGTGVLLFYWWNHHN